MTTNSLSNWLSIAPEQTPTAFENRSRRTRSGVVKSGMVKPISSPAPPDENTIRHLNALAATRPFNALHKVKKHDTL
jgi:hypothetical protein